MLTRWNIVLKTHWLVMRCFVMRNFNREITSRLPLMNNTKRRLSVLKIYGWARGFNLRSFISSVITKHTIRECELKLQTSLKYIWNFDAIYFWKPFFRASKPLGFKPLGLLTSLIRAFCKSLESSHIVRCKSFSEASCNPIIRWFSSKAFRAIFILISIWTRAENAFDSTSFFEQTTSAESKRKGTRISLVYKPNRIRL